VIQAIGWALEVPRTLRHSPKPGCLESNRLRRTCRVSPCDLETRASYQAFFERTRGFHLPDSELDQYEQFGDGSPEVLQAILTAAVRPEYHKITSPALALYSMPRSARDLFPAYDVFELTLRPQLDTFWSRWAAAVESEHERFRREVAHAKAVDVDGATHYLFLSNTRTVMRVMSGFLGALH
jgi:hypothetical protein